MKLLISLILCFPSVVSAKVIVLAYPKQHLAHAEHMASVMQRVHHIPGEFIKLVESTEPCREYREAVSWHLCLNDNGDLLEVAVDKSFKETLRVFL